MVYNLSTSKYNELGIILGRRINTNIIKVTTTTQTDYYDLYGNEVEPKEACKIITREYDKNGKLIKTHLVLEPRPQYLLITST